MPQEQEHDHFRGFMQTTLFFVFKVKGPGTYFADFQVFYVKTIDEQFSFGLIKSLLKFTDSFFIFT